MEAEKKKELWRAFKFFCFSVSAGVIQLAVTTLVGLSPLPASAVYLIGLVASVVWNFTFNRKFTFKAANNVPKAMALAFLFYVFFAPASTLLTAWLTNGDVLGLFTLPSCLGILGSNLPSDQISLGAAVGATVVTTIICMIPNLILEFLWQKFVVFRGSIDTNKKAQEEKEKESK